MPAIMRTFESREEWLKARKSYIGGSDAACIVGANPWKSNLRLWQEKTGRADPEDISEHPLVKYGTQAERHLRGLFRLDYPELKVYYREHNLWTNDRMPYAHASLDGWLTEPGGRKGILEIKTTTIQSSAQKDKWKDRIPQNYYIQLLHYLLVTEYDFTILKAQLKFEIEGEEPFMQTRHYRMERDEVVADLEFLENSEKEFAEHIKKDIPPALILPEI